ncbi:hypothetical protein JW992_10770, partial [candidate division KSB1 bacterium]|nr:hypothetical protein [candidate division KSB1 bacterium]
AQAIVARTFAIHNFSRRHSDAEFDYCADVHCQAYAGVEKEAAQSDRAVFETRGLVLTRDGRTCFTPYSAICGGHTEDVSAIWGGDAESHLGGVFDVPDDRVPQSLDLSQEAVVGDWIRTPVHVYCNVDFVGGLSAADYSKSYFRWRERLERTELEMRIRRETGIDLGLLQEIRPLRRSVSGRIIEIEFVGTKDRLRVENELRIRQLMSPKTLYSSCFVVEPVFGAPAPQEFVLHGAGWGHGVGMCQIGAAMMAKTGLSEKRILQHYYPGTKIEALY